MSNKMIGIICMIISVGVFIGFGHTTTLLRDSILFTSGGLFLGGFILMALKTKPIPIGHQLDIVARDWVGSTSELADPSIRDRVPKGAFDPETIMTKQNIPHEVLNVKITHLVDLDTSEGDHRQFRLMWEGDFDLSKDLEKLEAMIEREYNLTGVKVNFVKKVPQGQMGNIYTVDLTTGEGEHKQVQIIWDGDYRTDRQLDRVRFQVISKHKIQDFKINFVQKFQG